MTFKPLLTKYNKYDQKATEVSIQTLIHNLK